MPRGAARRSYDAAADSCARARRDAPSEHSHPRVLSPKMDAAIAKLTPENVKLALTCLYALAGAPKGSHV